MVSYTPANSRPISDEHLYVTRQLNVMSDYLRAFAMSILSYAPALRLHRAREVEVRAQSLPDVGSGGNLFTLS